MPNKKGICLVIGQWSFVGHWGLGIGASHRVGAESLDTQYHLSGRMLGRTAQFRPGRILWGTLFFLLGFAVLIVFISNWYLLPALDAAKNAAPGERRALSAHARLLLSVVLFILIAGILLTFRFGRFFLPRQREPRKPTQYVDAWSESARRMQSPPPRGD